MRLFFRSPNHSVLGAGDRAATMAIEIGDTYPPIVYVDFKNTKPGAELNIDEVKNTGRLRWSVQADGRVTSDPKAVRTLLSSSFYDLKAAWKGFDVYQRDGRGRGEFTPKAQAAYLAFQATLKKTKWAA